MNIHLLIDAKKMNYDFTMEDFVGDFVFLQWMFTVFMMN